MSKEFSKEHKKNLSESHKGIILSLKTRNKISESLKGHKHSLETKKKIGKANFKERDIAYVTIHKRVKTLYGEPRYCEICKSIKKKKYEWSNKDHSYRMPINKDDWQRLCTSCHRKYDMKILELEGGDVT